MEGYYPYQIKKEELSGDISKFPPRTYLDIVNYFLFSLRPQTKEELKAYKICGPAISSYQDESRK